LAVRAQTDHARPFFWAAFQVIGDTSALRHNASRSAR